MAGDETASSSVSSTDAPIDLGQAVYVLTSSGLAWAMSASCLTVLVIRDAGQHRQPLINAPPRRWRLLGRKARVMVTLKLGLLIARGVHCGRG